MKQAIMIGAGNIGRGFIGAILSRSGYHVTFADVNMTLIDAINAEGRYTVHIQDRNPAAFTITNIDGISSAGPELAEALKMPVIVHEREAHGDAMDIIRRHPDVRGVFHCFSGSKEMALWLVERGWYIGFTGVLTFKNARKAVETAQVLPLDRILIETDCPYMAPEPYRGRRNDSRYVPLVAKKLAELRGLTPEEAGRQTTENARRLFEI